MHDPDYYPNPDHFDGLRYTRHRMRDDRNGERERENPMFGDAVTEVRREFPVWGFGGHVWFVFPFPSSPPPSILPTITHPPHFSLPPPPLIHTQIYPRTNPPTHKSTHITNPHTNPHTHTHKCPTKLPLTLPATPYSPGRYHAALVLKMVLIHLLSTYECKLAAPGQPWKWWWDNLAMPYQGTRVLLRRRGGGGGG